MTKHTTGNVITFNKKRTPADDEAEAWHDEIQRTEKGKPLANLSNTNLALTKSKNWEGAFGYDEFADRVVLQRKPPWDSGKAGIEWNDNCEFHTRLWFEGLPDE